MAFSSAVKLTDLNDHISPGVACINPTMMNIPGNNDDMDVIKEEEKKDEVFEVSIHKKGEVEKSNHDIKPATITLNDCLACSGCITSAEAVLVNMQDEKVLTSILDKMNNRQNNNIDDENIPKIMTISISPQSRASLAAKFNMSTTEIQCRLTTFFKKLGIHHVYDISFARDISLMIGAKEFIRRYKESNNLPMLSSSCPGWICYAEKSQHELLPLIDITKSPQQIMGSLVKLFLSNKYNMSTKDIFHATVMPCYDKKLEASRSIFTDIKTGAKDVDCVITTGQLMRLLLESGVNDLNQIEPSLIFEEDFIKLSENSTINNFSLSRSMGSSSGGYLSYIFCNAAKELFNININIEDLSENTTHPNIKRVQGRNPDWIEWLLVIDNEIKLRFASTYGFRNIQNLVRKISPNQNNNNNNNNNNKPVVRRVIRNNNNSKVIPLQFVEVMACPTGCINGGGQLIMDENFELINDENNKQPNVLSKVALNKIDNIYKKEDILLPEKDSKVLNLFESLLNKYDLNLSSLNNEFQILLNNYYYNINNNKYNELASLLLTKYNAVDSFENNNNNQPLAIGSNW